MYCSKKGHLSKNWKVGIDDEMTLIISQRVQEIYFVAKIGSPKRNSAETQKSEREIEMHLGSTWSDGLVQIARDGSGSSNSRKYKLQDVPPPTSIAIRRAAYPIVSIAAEAGARARREVHKACGIGIYSRHMNGDARLCARQPSTV